MQHRLYPLGFLLCFLLAPSLVQGQALPIKKDGQWGAINAQGGVVIEPQYEFLSNFDHRGWAAFRKEGKAGIITEAGKELLPASFEQVRPLSSQFIAVWNKGQCGIVNTDGKEVITPSFDNIDTLTHSLFRVQIAGKYGISDKNGKAILAANHEQMGSFKEGNHVAAIAKNDQKGLIILHPSRQEVTVYEAVYDKVKESETGEYLLYKGNEILGIQVDSVGNILAEQRYTNQMDYKISQDKKMRQNIVASGQNPGKPRWTRDGFQYQLTNAFGKNLLGNLSFFQLNIDEKQGLAMGVAQKGEGKEAKDFCYIIQADQAKILMNVEAKDLIITDFQDSEYARITLDTLFDGLVNKSGKVIQAIDGQDITNIGNFKNGLAYVHANGKYGFINGKGELAIPMQYNLVSEFNNGYAVAKQNGKFGCINTSGQAAIPFEYDGIDTPTNGLVRAKKGRGRSGKWGIINMQNNVIAPFEYTVIGAIKDGEAVARKGPKLGVINTEGKVVVPIAIEADYLAPFNNGIAEIGMERMVENIAGRPEIRYKYKGYVNRDGVIIVPPKYEFIYHFDSVWQAGIGVAKVVIDNKVGYLDPKGTVIVPPAYTKIEGFEEAYMTQKGLAKVRVGNKFGYINAQGKQVLAPAYSSVDGFAATLQDTTKLAKASIDGKFGYINHREVPVIPLIYDLVSPIFDQSVIVKSQGKQGIVSIEHDTLLPIEYDGIRLLKGSQNTLLLTYKSQPELVRFDSLGRVKSHTSLASYAPEKVVGQKDSKYKYITDFNQYGIAVIQDDKKQVGLAKADGKVIVKPDYQTIGKFSEGLAPFKVDHKDRSKQLWGYLNTQGNEVIDGKYSEASVFGNNRGLVLYNRQWGYIDKTGNMVIKPSYRQAAPFSGGYAVVNQTQIIDINGQQKGEMKLEEAKIISGFSGDRAIVEVPSGQLHIRPNGKPAYYVAYDEVTPYIGSVAFVKKGEEWALTRSVNGREMQVPFTKAGMRAYKKQYGNRDKKTTKEGIDIKDVKWTKTRDGVWRMIDAQGYFVGQQVYENVEPDLLKQEFRAQVAGLVGLANFKGEVLLPSEQEQIQYTDQSLIQIVSFGKIGYLTADGKWVWEMTE